MMSKPLRAAAASLSLVTLGMLGLLAVPTAAAHDCYELVPTAGGCGGCYQGHEGTHTFGFPALIWCSSDSTPSDAVCALLQNWAFVECRFTDSAIALS